MFTWTEGPFPFQRFKDSGQNRPWFRVVHLSLELCVSGPVFLGLARGAEGGKRQKATNDFDCDLVSGELQPAYCRVLSIATLPLVNDRWSTIVFLVLCEALWWTLKVA